MIRILALLCLPTALSAQLGHVTTTKTPSGAVKVMSDGPTMWRDTTGWKLVLDHVVQPAEGSAGELGKPDNLVLFPDGRLLVAEDEPGNIKLYDATGKFIRQVGRVGSGPGEFRSPFLTASDKWIVVHDPQLTRITLFRLDGTLIRSFTGVCCNFGPTPFVDAAGRISAVNFGTVNGVSSSRWTIFDSLGHIVDSMPTPTAMKAKSWEFITKDAAGKMIGSTRYNIPLAPSNMAIRLPDGGFLHGRTDVMEFIVSRNGRDTARIFGRTGVLPVPVASAHRDSLYHQKVDKNERLRSVASLADVPTTYELWTGMHRDGAGDIWVGRGNGKTSGPTLFDVYSPTGVLLGTVASPWQDGLRSSWTGDRVAVLDSDANELPRVRVFRIVRNQK